MKREDVKGKWIIVKQDGTVLLQDYKPEDMEPDENGNTIFNRTVAVGDETYWEPARITQDITAVVNERGLIMEPPLKMNRKIPGLAGDILLCTTVMIDSGEGFEEPDLAPFNDIQAAALMATLQEAPTLPERRAEAERPTLRQEIIEIKTEDQLYNPPKPKPWTVERVKEELPDVYVSNDQGVQYAARIKGRQNEFATVYLIDNPNVAMEYAWQTIADALNRRVPLRM